MNPTNPRATRAGRWGAACRRLLADERGGEVIEWALVAGLVVIATIAAIGAVGTKVLARWNTVNNGL